jgi:hypothetical protein
LNKFVIDKKLRSLQGNHVRDKSLEGLWFCVRHPYLKGERGEGFKKGVSMLRIKMGCNIVKKQQKSPLLPPLA